MKNEKKFEDQELWERLPVEIQDRMLKEQVMQGNPISQITFMNNIHSGIEDGGFDWGDSEAGGEFWATVIDGSWGLFYAVYGNQDEDAEKQENKYVTPSKYGLSEGVEICCHLNGDSIHYEVDHRTGSIQLTEAEFTALKEAVQNHME